MNPVRSSIHSLLAGDATLTALLGDGANGVYYQRAPLSARAPWVLFNKQAGTPTRTMRGDAYTTDVWQVKGVSAGGLPGPAEDIAARLDVLLNDATLTITGQACLDLHKQSDIDYPEDNGADTYHHVGASYRLIRSA